MSFIKQGRCLCGEISYQIIDKPLFTHACHCTDCQKVTGSAFGLSMFILRQDFQMLSGTPTVAHPPQQYGVAAIYACGDCGCAIYRTHSYLDKFVFPFPGTFDDTTWVKPQAHIYTRSKQPWVQLADDEPAFEKQYKRDDVWPEASLKRLKEKP